MTLHLLWADPAREALVDACLRALVDGDTLVLGGEAVRALLPGTAASQRLLALDAGIRVHALAEDCTRFAIPPSTGAQVLMPAELVALVCAHERSVSWF